MYYKKESQMAGTYVKMKLPYCIYNIGKIKKQEKKMKDDSY